MRGTNLYNNIPGHFIEVIFSREVPYLVSVIGLQDYGGSVRFFIICMNVWKAITGSMSEIMQQELAGPGLKRLNYTDKYYHNT